MFPQMLAFVAILLLLLSLSISCLRSPSTPALVPLLGGVLGVNTFLVYGFFDTVPRELDEAAKIDGACACADLLHDHRRADDRAS